MLAFSVCWWTPSVTGYGAPDVFVAAILSPFAPTSALYMLVPDGGPSMLVLQAAVWSVVFWTAVFQAIHRVRAKRCFSERTTDGALS
jgi:hypothetical protein